MKFNTTRIRSNLQIVVLQFETKWGQAQKKEVIKPKKRDKRLSS